MMLLLVHDVVKYMFVIIKKPISGAYSELYLSA